VKPPDDATSTKTKEAAKRERTEEEIDADLALLQGAANTLDPKKPGKINKCGHAAKSPRLRRSSAFASRTASPITALRLACLPRDTARH